MKMRRASAMVAVALSTAWAVPAAQAGQPGVYITEFLANKTDSNFFVELTNTANIAIDITGWTFSTNASRLAGEYALIPASHALLGAGQSLFITSACDGTGDCDNEAGEMVFQQMWGLPSNVKVLHVGTDNYSEQLVGWASSNFVISASGDTLRLTNASSLTVHEISYTSTFAVQDRSTYVKDQDLLTPGIETVNSTKWGIASVGDLAGSYAAFSSSAPYEVGNPNSLTFAPVPEPETYAMMLVGLGLVGVAAGRRHRRGSRP